MFDSPIYTYCKRDFETIDNVLVLKRSGMEFNNGFTENWTGILVLMSKQSIFGKFANKNIYKVDNLMIRR